LISLYFYPKLRNKGLYKFLTSGKKELLQNLSLTKKGKISYYPNFRITIGSKAKAGVELTFFPTLKCRAINGILE